VEFGIWEGEEGEKEGTGGEAMFGDLEYPVGKIWGMVRLCHVQ
jgi:hypothetical protein